MTIMIDVGNILYWVAIMFAVLLALGVVFLIWASLVNLVIALFGLDRPIYPCRQPALVGSWWWRGSSSLWLFGWRHERD